MPFDSAPQTLPNRDRDSFDFIIDTANIRVESMKLLRTMDTVADAVNVTFPWTPGADRNLDRVTRILGYYQCKAYLGGQKMFAGYVYDVTQSYSNSGRKKDLGCFSPTVNYIDSNVRPPYSRANITLVERCKEFVSPANIDVVTNLTEAELGGAFPSITATESDTVFAHLLKLAKQCGVLLSSTVDGDLEIVKANTTGNPVANITEPADINQGLGITVSGRSLFSYYEVSGQNQNTSAFRNGVVRDPQITAFRDHVFQANDSSEGNIIGAAAWKRSKLYAESLSFDIPVTTWYDDNGNLWAPNTLVTVVSETMSLPDGFTFLIKQVEFSLDSNGAVATLSVVPPQVYSGEAVPLPPGWGQIEQVAL